MNFRTKFFGKAYYYEDNVPKKIDINYYYLAEVECLNCGGTYRVYIRKGRYVKDITTMIRCKKCLCTLKNCKCNTCN